MPLVSIAISDRRFQNKDGNNWSGPPEGLTVQVCISIIDWVGPLPWRWRLSLIVLLPEGLPAHVCHRLNRCN